MKLSVMITTYNLAGYVDETLRSVISQETDFDYEILVGDDGSSDRTIEIVKSWQEKYPSIISLYVMDRVQGKAYSKIERASKNRLNLLAHARGEYLIFLDGDDVYTDSRKLAKQVEVLDNPENEGAVMCAHNIWIYWNDDKKELLNSCQSVRRVKGKDYWKYGIYFHSDTVMFRNIFDRKMLADIPCNYYDDNIIVFLLLDKGDIIYIPDVMTNYRQLQSSSWNSVDELEKNIINIMDWDVELRINRSYQKATVYRHLYPILYLWKNNSRITEEMRTKYLPQMDRDSLWNAKKWFTYGEQKKGVKAGMVIWLGWQLFKYIFVKLGKMLPKYKMN